MNIEINLLKLANMMADRELLLQVCIESGDDEDESWYSIYDTIEGKTVIRDNYYDRWLDIYNTFYATLEHMSTKKEELTAEPTTDESEERAMFEFSLKLQDAIDKLTIETFDSLDYGEETELNDEYTIYHYSEDDIVVINRIKNDEGNDEWTEVLQVMTDGINFTFEEI